jgi:structural maintenance of chromosome 1
MKRYDMAVTVAGGKDMDAVVVDTKQTAFECIQYLRTNQIGTATFLPLDSLQVPNLSSTERIRSLINQDSRYRLAYDVIQCADDSVKKAVLYAVGNTVVCEDLDSARNICFGHRNKNENNEDSRIKAVTLGGAVISKAGTMTGGISSEERSRAGRWNDRDVEKLRERKEELECQLVELNKAENGVSASDRRISRGGRAGRVEELRNQLGNFTNRLQFAESDIKYTKDQLKEQQTLIKSVSTQITKVSKTLQDTELLVESLNNEVQKIIQQVKDAEEEHYGPFRESTGMTDFRAYDEALGKAREKFLKKRTTIREHLETLKAQKKYEEDRNFDEVLSKKEKEISILEKKLAKAKISEDKINKSVSAHKAKLANVEAELEDANNVEKRYEDEVCSAQADYKEAQTNGAKLSKTLNSEEADIERLRVKLHETLQKARVEEAEIPFAGDAEESESNISNSSNSQLIPKRRSSRSKSEKSDSQGSSDPQTQGTFASMHFSQADDSRVVKDRHDTDRIDFSSLREDLKNRLSDKKEKDLLKRFEDSIESISAQIEGMAPNMKAGDAFDAVVDQLEECNEDFSKAKELSKEASQYFEEIKNQRSDRFNTAFKHVSDALTTIYKDMTKSSKHPLGGNAYLSIDDADEPYNGGIKFTAMPPMKRYRDMEYLSGGEKTIAALALLFAIHSYHPAPFFVMDEVDAALDNVNVLKLCNYIRQRSKDFQCIVISLKDMFFEKSESLVGICRDAPTNSSRTLTLDLTKFDIGEESITSTSISSSRKRSSSFSGISNKRNRSLQ